MTQRSDSSPATPATRALEPRRSLVRVGVSRVDITPPVGIYHRMWGAAKHDRSTGIHRPLTATVLAIGPQASQGSDGSPSGQPALIAIALDHCLFWSAEMKSWIESVARSAGVDPASVHVFFSHTHGAGLMGLERVSLPGGDLIPDYLRTIADEVARGVRDAIGGMAPATITFETGRCALATNRDYLDPQSGSYVCGFNPDRPADDTLILGRVTSPDGKTLATLLNYACHPTTLAWDNTLISPDYVGATREVIESQTGAPCFFIQGASGDVGPRHGFVGDCGVADANGRQLGHAALATLEGMFPPDQRFCYAGPVVSGATIGTWRFEPIPQPDSSRHAVWRQATCRVDLPLREDLPDRGELIEEQRHWQQKQAEAAAAGDDQAAADCRAMVERATRRLVRVAHLPEGKTFPYQATLFRMGDAVWVPLNGEHYNCLQVALRDRFPKQTLLIATLVNGSDVWYLPDAESYGKGLYQEEASILAEGSLEMLVDVLAKTIDGLFDRA